MLGERVANSGHQGGAILEHGYGSIPINTIFNGMNIHLPAILMFTRGTRFWHTATCQIILLPLPLEVWTSSDNGSTETLNADFVMASQINSGTVLPWDFRYTSQFPKNFFARSPCLESATWGCSWAYQWLQYYYIYILYIYTLYIYILHYVWVMYICLYSVYIYIYIIVMVITSISWGTYV